jgi:hypothetical protein
MRDGTRRRTHAVPVTVHCSAAHTGHSPNEHETDSRRSPSHAPPPLSGGVVIWRVRIEAPATSCHGAPLAVLTAPWCVGAMNDEEGSYRWRWPGRQRNWRRHRTWTRRSNRKARSPPARVHSSRTDQAGSPHGNLRSPSATRLALGGRAGLRFLLRALAWTPAVRGRDDDGAGAGLGAGGRGGLPRAVQVGVAGPRGPLAQDAVDRAPRGLARLAMGGGGCGMSRAPGSTTQATSEHTIVSAMGPHAAPPLRGCVIVIRERVLVPWAYAWPGRHACSASHVHAVHSPCTQSTAHWSYVQLCTGVTGLV